MANPLGNSPDGRNKTPQRRIFKAGISIFLFKAQGKTGQLAETPLFQHF